MNYAPVVLFVYNRPEHTRQTVNALSRNVLAAASDLWVFSDGAKSEDAAAQVAVVREYVASLAGKSVFKSVTVVESQENKGLADSIIQGVTTVMANADRAIILEDDLVTAPDFLKFMNDCLDYYQDDPKVGSISGFSPLPESPANYTHDVMAIPRNCSHGWATWADRWSEVDWDARDAGRVWREPDLRRRFNAVGNDRLGRLLRQLEGRIDSWSIRFGLWQTLSGRYTIYPVQNRVRNIGFDGSGVHTRIGEEVNSESLKEARDYHLASVKEDHSVIRAVRRIYSGPLVVGTMRGARAWLIGLLKGF